MEKSNIVKCYGKYAVVYIIFIVGAVGHLIDATRPFMVAITPYTLLVMSTYVLYLSTRISGPLLLIWVIIAFTLTFMLEVAGVHTGLLFGTYEYGETLGTRLFGVPPIIGYNWAMVILGASSIAGRYVNRPAFTAMLTSILVVSFDFILEPVAIELGYWSWQGNGDIPMQNYLMWLLTGFMLAYSLVWFRVRFVLPLASHYFLSLTLFFIILQLFL